MKTHFKRYEIKYIIPSNISDRLIPQLINYMELDPYMKGEYYEVMSLYFDTADLRFYKEKVDGIKNRRKYRFRTYNNGQNNIFFEIKRKEDSIIIKDRLVLPQGRLEDYIDNNLLLKTNDIIAGQPEFLNEFNYYQHRIGLLPQVLVDYKRKAFLGKYDPNFRVTFDYDVICHNIKHNYFSQTKRITYENVVLELKFNNSLPHWFHSFIQTYQLQRLAFSKYCTAIDKVKYNIDYI